MYNVSIIYQFSDGRKELRHENGYAYMPLIRDIHNRRRSCGVIVYKVFVFKVK